MPLPRDARAASSEQHIATTSPVASTGTGWIDKRARGRLRFDGRDAATFLHALVTNDVASLGAGAGTYAAYLTPQGRMIADLRLYRTVDGVLADVPPGLAAPLAARFDALIFSEDVRVADVSASLGQIAIVGAEAAAALARAAGAPAPALDALATWSHLEHDGILIARTDDANVPAFDVFAAGGASADLIARLERAGVAPLPVAAAETLRIEAGRPAFGVDMTDDTIPLEAGIADRAISMAKGCYVGQEVIVRVLHRGGGRVVKHLMQLRVDDTGAGVRAGDVLASDDGRDLGRVTSVAASIDGRAIVALGYVHRDAAEVGRRITVRAQAGDVAATIVGFAS